MAEGDPDQLVGELEAEADSSWEAWWTECRYCWRRYRPMLARRGVVDMVATLVLKPGASPGFQKLKACGRLDLTLEATVLRERFTPLLTDDVRRAAEDRLGGVPQPASIRGSQ